VYAPGSEDTSCCLLPLRTRQAKAGCGMSALFQLPATAPPDYRREPRT
jgi:hypothetical protein